MVVRSLLTTALAASALAACAPRPAMCARSCAGGDSCVAGQCLRAGALSQVEAVDKVGLYQARRIVAPAIEIARLGPGDTRGEVSREATLARARDASAEMLLRFAIDLPPGSTVLEAHVLLDRAPSVDSDPTPITLRGARILDRWDERSVSWGRAPRVEDFGLPTTTVDDARRTVRIDVGAIVARWRSHARDDQGIAVLADRCSATGMAFAVADGASSGEDVRPLLPTVRPPSPPPAFVVADSADSAAEVALVRGPRLELYVKP